MLKGIAAGLALSLMVVASCSSSESNSNTFSCDSAKSKCPNDEPPDAEDRAQCNAIINDRACGTLYMAMLLCLADHQTCLPNGKTDEDTTAKACPDQVSAAEKCAGVDGGVRR